MIPFYDSKLIEWSLGVSRHCVYLYQVMIAQEFGVYRLFKWFVASLLYQANAYVCTFGSLLGKYCWAGCVDSQINLPILISLCVGGWTDLQYVYPCL